MKTMTVYRPGSIAGLLARPMSDFDHCFDSFFGDVLAPATRVFNHAPAVDIRETEKAYMLEMELPGYDEKDIDIHVDGGTLSVTSKREEVKNEEGHGNTEGNAAGNTENKGEWLLRERRTSSFSRSFKLPENANPEEVSAEFKNGILGIELKKRPEAQKRTIQINAK